MNFLAHLYLSKTEAQLVGNFIADHVKGKKLLAYPAEIQEGIRLHRAIDSFTDSHPQVRISKQRLFPVYRHYGAVLVDLFYDHLLASKFRAISGRELHGFTQEAYVILRAHWDLLPPKTQYMLPYMEADNWLYAYRSLEGIGQACAGLARRTRFTSGMETGAQALKQDYAAFEEDFTLFFPELEKFVKEWRDA